MKTRKGFVSNSSSSSFVVIDSGGGKKYDTYVPTGLEGTEGFVGETEFGWGPDKIYDIGSRINFAYLQTTYAGKDSKKWLKMLIDVLEKETGITDINWNMDAEYGSHQGRWAYIDHQSCAYEGENTEIFLNEKVLRDFLFGSGSYIVLDHDNY